MAFASVHTIFCIRPATGTDFHVLQAIANLAETVLSAEIPGPFLDGIQALPTVVAAIDVASADPDDLFITTLSDDVDDAIWPSPGETASVGAGQSFAPNLTFQFDHSQNISLFDDDFSSNDLLGSITMFASEAGMGEIAKVAKSDVEGSAYYVIYEVQ